MKISYTLILSQSEVKSKSKTRLVLLLTNMMNQPGISIFIYVTYCTY